MVSGAPRKLRPGVERRAGGIDAAGIQVRQGRLGPRGIFVSASVVAAWISWSIS